jgi:hypothetical protein
MYVRPYVFSKVSSKMRCILHSLAIYLTIVVCSPPCTCPTVLSTYYDSLRYCLYILCLAPLLQHIQYLLFFAWLACALLSWLRLMMKFCKPRPLWDWNHAHFDHFLPQTTSILICFRTNFLLKHGTVSHSITFLSSVAREGFHLAYILLHVASYPALFPSFQC